MTERKARAKSASKVGKGSCPQRKPKNNYFATLMETPEGRELRRQWSTKKRKTQDVLEAYLMDTDARRSNLSARQLK